MLSQHASHTTFGIPTLLHGTHLSRFVLDHGLRSALLFHEGHLFTDHRFGLFHFTTLCKRTALVGLHELTSHGLWNTYPLGKRGVICRRSHQVVLLFTCARHRL